MLFDRPTNQRNNEPQYTCDLQAAEARAFTAVSVPDLHQNTSGLLHDTTRASAGQLWPDWANIGQTGLVKASVVELLTCLGQVWPARAGQGKGWRTFGLLRTTFGQPELAWTRPALGSCGLTGPTLASQGWPRPALGSCCLTGPTLASQGWPLD